MTIITGKTSGTPFPSYQRACTVKKIKEDIAILCDVASTDFLNRLQAAIEVSRHKEALIKEAEDKKEAKDSEGKEKKDEK